jgi:hypothetical protein
MGSTVRPIFILAAVISMAFVACQENDPIDSGVDPPETRCIDHDKDGFGQYCEAGNDCDDLDETVWEVCEPDPDRCNIPRSGCPCEVEAEEVACRTSSPVVSDDGSELCYAGVRSCLGGIWTACESMEPYNPVGAEGDVPDDGANRDALLGDPTACVGSCDDTCMRTYDCPSGIDLTPANSTNVRYDLEFTYGATTYNAAVVLDDAGMAAGTGSFERMIEATCPADTMPVWWSIDWDFDFPEPGPIAEIQISGYTETIDGVHSSPVACFVSCPTSGACTCDHPICANDRINASDGNIFNQLDPNEANYGRLYLTFEINNNTAASPRLNHYEVFYFCDPAN